jgi:hypothetical protein
MPGMTDRERFDWLAMLVRAGCSVEIRLQSADGPLWVNVKGPRGHTVAYASNPSLPVAIDAARADFELPV